ncbi:MAG TPA: acyl-CoA dehydrogenase family protein [Deltaproteobacteria bacterium]|nr:acyl-CoA dehydrogenase family protein [Deltaproteobacteria bacterium]
MSYTELNLDLTDEHVSLRENAHKFALEVLRPAAIELDTMTPEQVIAKGSIYWDCMRKMYENGYHTVLIPDEYGGLGLDPLGIHIVFEELGYGSAGFAVSIGVSCFSAFYSSLIAEDHHIEKFIIPYAQCRDASVMSCWAITEPDHGSDILMPFTENFHNPKITQQVKATKKGDRYLLNGQKAAWVSNGTIATQAAIFVNIDPSAGMAGGGIGLIDLTQKGVTRGRPLNKMGQRELPQGEIYFDNAEVPVEDMIIDPESYEMFTDITLATANACMGAFFTGVAQSAYDLALAYTKERIQGGKPLCEHLSVQKKLFDMFSKVELARALSRAALQFNLSTSPPKTQYSIASKVFATTAAFEVASDALQLFGGNGLSKEYPIEKIFRDARAGMIEDGSNDILALAAAGLILRGE